MTQRKKTKKTTKAASKASKKTASKNSNAVMNKSTKESSLLTYCINWAKNDYRSCPVTLQHTMEIGLYSISLFCAAAIWTAIFLQA